MRSLKCPERSKGLEENDIRELSPRPSSIRWCFVFLGFFGLRVVYVMVPAVKEEQREI